MTSHDVDRHLTILNLDELALGSASAAQRRRIDAHLGRCTACATRRSARDGLHARFHAEVFPRTVAAVSAVAGRRRESARRRWTLALLLPALAAALLIFVRAPGHQPPPAGARDPVLGIKGGELFEVFARVDHAGSGADGPEIVRLESGARLAAGDALRFVLFPPGLGYVLIASLDGAGAVSIYYPFHGDESAPVRGRDALAVPGSIVLDDAPGPERLFVIYSERPIAARAVREALASTAAGGAGAIRALDRVPIAAISQATLLFEKGERP